MTAGTALEASGLRGTVEAREIADVLPALEEVAQAARQGLWAVGMVGYEAAPAFDPALEVVGVPAGATPLVWFGLFERLQPVPPVAGPAAPPVSAGPEVWDRELDERQFTGAVKLIHDEIAAGNTYQVNLTTRLRRGYGGSLSGAGRAMYQQLTSAQRGAYSAYLETDEWAVACGSPELFFSLADGRLTTRPMKGTALRGRFPSEDSERSASLTLSSKERAENVMIVDLMRNDFGRVAEIGTVAVPALYQVERYPTVWQMTSTVECELRPEVTLGDLFGAVFPPGSVTGAPKASTMSLIAALERSPRGPYCGAIGYVGPEVMRFAVGIRTAVLDRRSSAVEFGVGSGITWSAQPAAEWRELAAKASVLWRDPPPSELIETLAYTATDGLRNLDGHVRRMMASAEYYGWPCDENEMRSMLAATTASREGALRVRVRLSAGGRLSVEATPLDAPAQAPVRLELDDEPVDSSDPKLFHKTGDRHHLDRRLARHPGADDVVLVNERGELTETCRANLALEISGQWLTPALTCGCLPGVERQRLLDAGQLTEAVLRVPVLDHASGLAVVSSLRGWRPAVLGDHRNAPASSPPPRQ